MIHLFFDLLFGEYCYEMFNYDKELLATDLIKYIKEIIKVNIKITERRLFYALRICCVF